MTTAIDELMAHCKTVGLKRSRLMSRVYRFHRRNSHLLDFLLQELRVAIENDWKSTSFEMLWHHARWVLTYVNRVPGETFAVCQNFMPHFSRLAIILFPRRVQRILSAQDITGRPRFWCADRASRKT